MTSFAKKVYKVVLTIPLGQVRTYQWVAKKIGNPKASRAIGQILKHNPYPLIIPCHRVICSDRGLGGYVFGKKTKGVLLNLQYQKNKKMAKKEITYSEAISELEKILQEFENDEPDIDNLSEKVKRVSVLINLCKKKLKNTVDEVQKIRDNIATE